MWAVAAVVLLRYWDLTVRVEGVLVWTAVFLALYAGTMAILRAKGLTTNERPWSDVWLWLGILLAATAFQALVPTVPMRDRSVQTVALLRVFDIVLPLWILHRGVHACWTGRTAMLVTLATPAYLLAILWFVAIRMPGESFQGPSPPLSAVEEEIRDRSARHVRILSDSIGSRGFRSYESVRATAEYLRSELTGYGYEVEEQGYEAADQRHRNLQVTLPGGERADEIVVVGAHYDSYDLTPGADDNATGVAGVLELARLLSGRRPQRTLRLVLFGTEEPPFFNTDDMGSRVYAYQAAEHGERIVAMYSLEMLGYFTDEPGSQHHPPPLQLFFPSEGNFIAFVGNPASGALLRRSLATFRDVGTVPSEGMVSSSMVPGVELSDHASFWRAGFPAVLISDTGPFRNVRYHLESETWDELDFETMARVVSGVLRVVESEIGL